MKDAINQFLSKHALTMLGAVLGSIASLLGCFFLVGQWSSRIETTQDIVVKRLDLIYNKIDADDQDRKEYAKQNEADHKEIRAGQAAITSEQVRQGTQLESLLRLHRSQSKRDDEACVAACLMPGCTRTPSQAGFGATQPAPALLSCVAIGSGGGVLIDSTHALCTWHDKRNGTLAWPDGETATVAGWRRIGNTDICVLTLDHPLKLTPATICPLGKGWACNRLGKLLPVKPVFGFDQIEACWPACGLIMDDSGSPLLRDLGNVKVGVCALATSYQYGPALLAYASEIVAAK